MKDSITTKLNDLKVRTVILNKDMEVIGFESSDGFTFVIENHAIQNSEKIIRRLAPGIKTTDALSENTAFEFDVTKPNFSRFSFWKNLQEASVSIQPDFSKLYNITDFEKNYTPNLDMPEDIILNALLTINKLNVYESLFNTLVKFKPKTSTKK
jgi:hypothetical protein